MGNLGSLWAWHLRRSRVLVGERAALAVVMLLRQVTATVRPRSSGHGRPDVRKGKCFGGTARNARYTFKADHTVLLSDVVFSDRACNSEMVKSLVTGTYALGGVDAKIAGTYDLDLKGRALTLSLLDPTKESGQSLQRWRLLPKR